MNIVQALPPEWAEPGDPLPHVLDESCPCGPVLEAVPLSGGGVGHTLTHRPVIRVQRGNDEQRR